MIHLDAEELYISAVLLPIVLYYLFCCFVEIKKYPCEDFLIVYLHLQWHAVLTQIMLCLAEAVLRNSRKVKQLVKPSFKLSWETLFF